MKFICQLIDETPAWVFGLLSIFAIAGILAACTTTQQTVAANTISGIETGSTQLYEGYIAGVIKGQFPTDNVPLVSHVYNQLQADVILATVALQNNSNALAPSSLILDATNLVNAVSAAEAIK